MKRRSAAVRNGAFSFRAAGLVPTQDSQPRIKKRQTKSRRALAVCRIEAGRMPCPAPADICVYRAVPATFMFADCIPARERTDMSLMRDSASASRSAWMTTDCSRPRASILPGSSASLI